MKRFLLILILFLLITSAYGCQGMGLDTGAGEQFQGGTEAGNPPIDVPGYIGGTEAGNPPVGDQDGHGLDPREGESLPCIDGKDDQGEPCEMIDVQDKLEPSNMGLLHDHQKEEEAAQEGTITINPDAAHALGHMIDFGRNGPLDEDGKTMIAAPFPNQAVLKHVLPER